MNYDPRGARVSSSQRSREIALYARAGAYFTRANCVIVKFLPTFFSYRGIKPRQRELRTANPPANFYYLRCTMQIDVQNDYLEVVYCE